MLKQFTTYQVTELCGLLLSLGLPLPGRFNDVIEPNANLAEKKMDSTMRKIDMAIQPISIMSRARRLSPDNRVLVTPHPLACIASGPYIDVS